MTHSQGIAAAAGARPFFAYYGAPQVYFEMLSACLTGQLGTGSSDRERLASELNGFLGDGRAICLAQARLGIYLVLLKLLTPEKHKVILSPYTIYDVVNVVIAAGGTPVFADIDETSCNISVESVARLIDDNTGAVMVTHLHGLACEMSAFVSICQQNGVPLLEDCAQAFGGIYKGSRLGTIGDAGVFSFSMKKHVNCLYGGGLVVRDADLWQECRDFLSPLPDERRHRLMKRAALSLLVDLAHSRWLFRHITFPLLRRRVSRGDEMALSAVAFEHRPVQRNRLPKSYLCQMTTRQASLVSQQLPDVDRQIEIRTGYAREYHSILEDLTELQLPPLREDGSHVYLSFPVQVSERLSFQRELMAHGCDVRLQCFTNLASSPEFADFAVDCPNARKVAARVVLLPIHTKLGIQEVRRIGAVIRSLMR